MLMPPGRGARNRLEEFWGVDGCRSGWIVARLTGDGRLSWGHFKRFSHIVDAARPVARHLMVDMPIGLLESGRRGCEREARARLAPHRHASIFAAPRRPMLAFETYEKANAWGRAQGPEAGGGLSRQAWMIAPKIREVDAVMTPALQRWIGEAHPELAFARLNGGSPLRFAKRAPAGEADRFDAIRAAGLRSIRRQTGAALARYRGAARLDDLLDAAAIAFTARARAERSAWRLSHEERDARGLICEIWG